MKDLITIMLNGAFDNIKRILFASDRVTDMEMRNAILNGEVKPTRKVNEELCIGCSGCANICPTGSITMKPLQKIKIDEEKLAFISQYLATNSVITKHEISNVDNDADVVDEDSAVEDSIASVDADSAVEDSIASVDDNSAAEDSAKENGDD